MDPTKDITIYDIAKVLNISPATVSRGLKDHPGISKDTKKKIVETAREMGYQRNLFAQNLRAKKTNTIGVIIPRLNSYFMSSVIAGVEKVANERGYNLVISQSRESAKKEIENVNTMFNSRVDGLLISLSLETEDIAYFSTLLKKGIPIILFDRVLKSDPCTMIVIDNIKAGYDATIHLLDQGCKRIVHIGESFIRNVYADRLTGYKQALKERNIEIDPSLILITDRSEQGGIETAQRILKMNPLPDGIFAVNDSTAVSCIRFLKQAGMKVPEQIAMVGFNNDPISQIIEPNLTTINYPGREMGEVAATTLINAINRTTGTTLNTVVLRHELIVRESSMRKETH